MRTAYYRADVVLADVVYSGGLGSKPRPVVILSTEAYNQGGIKIVGAAITSNLSGPVRIGDVTVTEWQSAGLAFPSAVRGVMSAQDFSNAEDAIKMIMGF